VSNEVPFSGSSPVSMGLFHATDSTADAPLMKTPQKGHSLRICVVHEDEPPCS
jgi:hypothetical protein